VLSDDSISFYRKVSSEQDYDFLQFYIDNTKKQEWSGEAGWQRFAYPVTAGNHTFRWVYEKDFMATGGSDAAWIDYVVFPPVSMTVGIGQIQPVTSGVNVYPNPAKDLVHIDYFLTRTSDVLLTVCDVSGRIVRTVQSGIQTTGLNSEQLNSLDFTPGIYFVNLQIDNEVFVTKMLISR